LIKKFAVTLAAALVIASTGCGNDSKPPIVSYVARANSDQVPHLFKLNESAQTSTAVNIAIPDDAEFVSANSDATAVTYCREGENTFEIFVMGTDGVEKQLTTDADACESVFSPDGKTIAYISVASGDFQTFTMNVDGSNQQVLYAPAEGTLEQFFPEFSPDSKSVVFYVESTAPAAGVQRRLPSGRVSRWLSQPKSRSAASTHRSAVPGIVTPSSGWYTMALTDTIPTLVYPTVNIAGPTVYSGDGTKLLVTDFDGNAANIFSVNLDGTAVTQITTSTDEADFGAVSYKNLILFNRTNSTGDTLSVDIYVMDQTGSNQVLVHSTADTWETLLDSFWFPEN